MADIYLLDVRAQKAPLLSLLDSVSPSRRERALKMRKESARLCCIGAEVCLSCALNLPLPLNLKAAENGKPYS